MRAGGLFGTPNDRWHNLARIPLGGFQMRTLLVGIAALGLAVLWASPALAQLLCFPAEICLYDGDGNVISCFTAIVCI